MALAVGANSFAAQPSPSVMAAPGSQSGGDPAIHENTVVSGSASYRESPISRTSSGFQRRRVDGISNTGERDMRRPWIQIFRNKSLPSAARSRRLVISEQGRLHDPADRRPRRPENPAAAALALRLKALERGRIVVQYANRGVPTPEIAARIGVADSKARAMLRDALARSLPETPEEFAAIQMSRLNEALLVAYSAMGDMNLKAVDRVVRIVRALDRYYPVVAARPLTLASGGRPRRCARRGARASERDARTVPNRRRTR